MDLSVITVNKNDKTILKQLASVKPGAAGLTFEQIVVDNGSADGSLAEIRAQFPEVKVVELGKNTGFGFANNRGVEVSRGEFLLILNPDMLVEAGSLKKILDWMRAKPEVGIASCKLLDEQGKFNEGTKPRRLPRLFDQLAILLKLPHLFPKVIGHYLYKDFDPGKEQEVDSVRGSFMLMRREIFIKLGWIFDPRYFIWFEDVDTCQEVKKMGLKVVYTPLITCVDYVGQTFKKDSGLQKQKWFTESMVKYFKKWEPWYKWIWLVIFRPLGIFLVFLSDKYLALKKT